MSTNELRMPLAEWMVRMSEASVPYQARALALYAVVLKVSDNEELAVLTGMDTKGVADKTYNKWKKYLSDNGWVIVRQITIGRKTTVEIGPAFKESPVIFTDVKPREPRKFYGSSPVTITDAPAVESTAEPELVTDQTRNNYERTVEITDVPQKSPHTPLKDNNIINTTTTTTVEQEAASGGGIDFDALNGTAIDLTKFIAKHGFMPTENARLALATNIKTFGADAMMEAFSLTLAEMAGGMLGKPYKYLIETARKLKGGGRNKHQEPDESKRDKRRAYLEKLDREEAAKKGRFGHDRS